MIGIREMAAIENNVVYLRIYSYIYVFYERRLDVKKCCNWSVEVIEIVQIWTCSVK